MKKCITVVLVVVGIASLLTGCEQLPNDPLAVRATADSAIEIAVCESVDVGYLYLSVYRPTGSLMSPRMDVGFIDADRESALPVNAGDVLDPRREFAPVTEIPTRAGDEVTIMLANDRAQSKVSLSAQFVVPKGGLPTEEWVRADGSVGRDPCPFSVNRHSALAMSH